MVYDVAAGEMEELFADDKFDFIRVKEDRDGNLYCIKRPYNPRVRSNIIVDVILFPWRMIKAIFGFFNFIAVVFGGEGLRSNQDPANRRDGTKAKQKSERELYIDGNVVNAEQMYKRNKQRGEKFPGMIPHSWELTKITPDNKQICLKKGVLDYTLCENGDILYSNGHAIVRMFGNDGNDNNTKEELVEKCRLANNITII
jgi:hypothetical protein